MNRALVPGRWNRHGRAVPDRTCCDGRCHRPGGYCPQFPPKGHQPVYQRPAPSRHLRGRVAAVVAASLVCAGTLLALAPIGTTSAAMTLLVGLR